MDHWSDDDLRNALSVCPIWTDGDFSNAATHYYKVSAAIKGKSFRNGQED